MTRTFDGNGQALAGGEAAGASDITVNLAGLWLLQALLGIPRLAAELRAWPYGQPRDTQWLADHPGLGVLVAQGICDEGAVVRGDIAARMRALAAPDVEVIVLVSPGPMSWSPVVDLDDPATWRAVPADQLRVALARREGRWVSAVRTGEQITIDDCPAAADAQWLAQLVCDALDTIHCVAPARFSAVNVPVEEMCAAVAARASAANTASGQAALKAVGLRGAALAQVGAALDEPAAEALLYARAYCETVTQASESVLDLRDSDSGRVALYRVNPPLGTRQQWMTVAPGSAAQVGHAVSTVLGSVAVRAWETHERMA